METTFFTALLLFGGSIFWTLVVIGVFLILCIYADLVKNGYLATLWAVVLAAMYYAFAEDKGTQLLSYITWSHVIGYLLIGLVYVVIRLYVEGKKVGARVKDRPTHDEYLLNKRDWDTKPNIDRPSTRISESETREYHVSLYKRELRENIARWWFLWWISSITWVISDIFKDIWKTVYNIMKNFFFSIFDLGVKRGTR